MLIASCTSYPARIGNLPTVITTILDNTISPDKVVVNLSLDEFPGKVLPTEVQNFFDNNDKIQINWVKGNWRVYKKFLPTLKIYPNELIFAFDDDMKYPPTIIEEFMQAHEKYPNAPITGNHHLFQGLHAHCGMCSLIQAKHFDGWEQYVDDYFSTLCPSSDLFYTQLAAINGYLYRTTDTNYYNLHKTMEFNAVNPYSRFPKLKLCLRILADVFGESIYRHFSDSDNKPLCVLNVSNVPRGLEIMEEMLEWLTPKFNVFVVRHDGTKFEYPALKFLQNLVTSGTYDEPIFYLHTKGAYHVRRESAAVRNMWRIEFTTKQRQYLKAVNVDEPMVATPYAGIITTACMKFPPPQDLPYNLPYENGWCANAAAIRNMDFYLSDNRYVYEMKAYKNMKMVGLRMNGIDFNDKAGRMAITNDIFTTFGV